MPAKDIYYSDKYFDEKYEYRHVMLPKDITKLVPKNHVSFSYSKLTVANYFQAAGYKIKLIVLQGMKD